MIKIKQ